MAMLSSAAVEAVWVPLAQAPVPPPTAPLPTALLALLLGLLVVALAGLLLGWRVWRRLNGRVAALQAGQQRLRLREQDHLQLWQRACEVAGELRSQLDVDQVPHDAAALVGAAFGADQAYIHLVVEGRLGRGAGWAARQVGPGRAPVGQHALRAGAAHSAEFAAESLERLRSVYRRVPSHGTDDGAAIFVHSDGAASVLTMPFGLGDELLGSLVLVRHRLRHGAGSTWRSTEVAAAGAVADALAQSYDLARQHRRERERVAGLAEADRVRGEFLSTVSHELRTPLTSIVGYLESLSDGDAGPVNEAQHAMIGTIERNCQRLRGLLDDLLTLSQVESGTFGFVRAPVDLVELVAGAVADTAPAAARALVTLQWLRPAQAVVVAGDHNQLYRAVINLLSNAVKFTPAGGQVSLAVATDTSGAAVLTVSDTGIGIPAPEQGQLFTRFFRASNATSRVIEGTGLGPSIVATIVGQHGGALDLSSVEQQGTTVTIRLPAELPAGRDPDDLQTGEIIDELADIAAGESQATMRERGGAINASGP